MSWNVTDHVTIYRELGWYAAHPNLVRTPSGDLLVLFHRATDLGYSHHRHPLFDMRSCRSADEGQTWSDARFVVSDPLGGILDHGAHTLSDGSIFLHCSNVELRPEQCDPIDKFRWRITNGGKPFWSRSKDDGNSWSEPTRFPPLPDALWGAPATHSGICRSGMLECDGRLLLPSKATHREEGRKPYFGMMRVSHDMGASWEYGGRIAEDDIAHFSEPAIVQTESGRILVLFRCYEGPDPDRYPWFISMVYSDDGGETWSEWQKTTIQGCPAHLLKLSDGRILFTVGTRWEGQYGCKAKVLNPAASDLDDAPDIIVRSDSNNSDCGYPWSVELNDGRVLVVYYFVYEDDTVGIEGSILEET
ncbi:MAG: sialidase family protein [Planctomycetota bacterium]|nr:sialidase family protein [Planctomycetota bacterium]